MINKIIPLYKKFMHRLACQLIVDFRSCQKKRLHHTDSDEINAIDVFYFLVSYLKKMFTIDELRKKLLI